MNEYIPKTQEGNSPFVAAFGIAILMLGFGLGTGFGYFVRSSEVGKLQHQLLSLMFYEGGYKTIAIYNTFLAEGGTREEWYDRGTRVRAIDELNKRFHENITTLYVPMLKKELKEANPKNNYDDFVIDETVDE